jgi:hypothetical protein
MGFSKDFSTETQQGSTLSILEILAGRLFDFNVVLSNTNMQIPLPDPGFGCR